MKYMKPYSNQFDKNCTPKDLNPNHHQHTQPHITLNKISNPSIGKKLENIEEEILIPSSPNSNDPSYNALMLIKGLPWRVDAQMILNWAYPLRLCFNGIILIYDENKKFTGDAFLRFINTTERDKAFDVLQNKYLDNRYIKVYHANPYEYEEFFLMGFKKQPKERNYVAPKLIAIMEDEEIFSKPISIDDLYCGMKLKGRITSIHHFGAFVDCNVIYSDDQLKNNKIIGLLRRFSLPKNVGLSCQDESWKLEKELILHPGLYLNIYVQSVDYKTKDKPLISYTLDASISSYKLNWWKSRGSNIY